MVRDTLRKKIASSTHWHHVPNWLTIARLAAVPVVIMSFYIPYPFARWIGAVTFVFACVTDFLDGFFARLWGYTSTMGRILDPIADKVLVAATLLMLVGFDVIGQLSLIPAVIILLREILVSGLREFLSDLDVPLPVSRLAKWKTAVQMMAIVCFLVQDVQPLFPLWLWHALGLLGLWFAAGLTVYTGYDYVRVLLTDPTSDRRDRDPLSDDAGDFF